MPIKFNKPAPKNPPADQQGQTGTASATLTNKTKGEVTAQETQEEAVAGPAVMAAAPVAYVEAGASYTKNLGDFNSAKVEVHLRMPSTVDTIEETYAFTSEWVSEKLNALVADLGE